MVSKKTKLPAATLASNRYYRATNLVIGLPLMVSLIFAFSYLNVQAKQRAVTAAHDKQSHSVTAESELLLVTHPDLPTLSQAADDSQAPAPAADSVGPSPTNAGATLQSSSRGEDNKGNAQLQATRKAMKLDDLNL